MKQNKSKKKKKLLFYYYTIIMPKIECVFYLGDSGWAQLSWLLVRNKTYLLNRLLQILQNQSLTLATPSLLWDSLADRIRECEQAISSFIINRDSHRIQWKKQLLSSEAFLPQSPLFMNLFFQGSINSFQTHPQAFSEAELSVHLTPPLFLICFCRKVEVYNREH